MSDSGFPGGITALMATYIQRSHVQLKSAIDSIYKNSITPDQVLIICDGPISPDSLFALEEFKNQFENFQYMQLPNNVGLANALNYGLTHVRTAWVARCDDDDINMPTRFEEQLKCLQQHPFAKIIGSNIIEVDSNGRYLSERCVPEHTQEIISMLSKRNPFNHMTVVYELSEVKKAGLYPQLAYEDYGLWIKLLHKKIEAVNVQKPLVYALTGNDMLRRRGGFKIAKTEIELGNMMYRYGFNSIYGAYITSIFRAIAALAPSIVRKFIYKSLLRNKNR